jgi:hypothetical protein
VKCNIKLYLWLTSQEEPVLITDVRSIFRSKFRTCLVERFNIGTCVVLAHCNQNIRFV